jgi:hypothetical protein
VKYAVEMASSDMTYITKFHEDRFRNSSIIVAIDSTISEAAVLLLLKEEIYEVRR